MLVNNYLQWITPCAEKDVARLAAGVERNRGAMTAEAFGPKSYRADGEATLCKRSHDVAAR